jgi:hypothetical protein
MLKYLEIIPILIRFKSNIYTELCEYASHKKLTILFSNKNKIIISAFVKTIANNESETQITSDAVLTALVLGFMPNHNLINDVELQNHGKFIYELFLSLHIFNLDRFKNQLLIFNQKFNDYKMLIENPTIKPLLLNHTYVNMLRVSIILDEKIVNIKHLFNFNKEMAAIVH